METILKWRNPNEIPEIGRRIAVLYEDNLHGDGVILTSGITLFKSQVEFCGKKVIAWAYADNLVEVENSLESENHFNQEWVDKLHNLACNGVGNASDSHLEDISF